LLKNSCVSVRECLWNDRSLLNQLGRYFWRKKLETNPIFSHNQISSTSSSHSSSSHVTPKKHTRLKKHQSRNVVPQTKTKILQLYHTIILKRPEKEQKKNQKTVPTPHSYYFSVKINVSFRHCIIVMQKSPHHKVLSLWHHHISCIWHKLL